LFHGTFQKAARDPAPCKFEGAMVTKDGQRLRMAWSLQIMRNPEGKPKNMLLSGLPCPEPAAEVAPARCEPERKEMRTSPRRFFQYRQMIAPMLGDEMPSREDFFEVDCCDISASGLSFYLDQVPKFEKLIIALGKPPAATHCAAEVVRYVEKVRQGQRQYLVGCRFLGRAEL
jgi:hypothetical protein